MARKFIIDSLKFWVKEYGIDGFRFDLMALIDPDTMRQAEQEVHAINPSVVIYGEPWGAGRNAAARFVRQARDSRPGPDRRIQR